MKTLLGIVMISLVIPVFATVNGQTAWVISDKDMYLAYNGYHVTHDGGEKWQAFDFSSIAPLCDVSYFYYASGKTYVAVGYTITGKNIHHNGLYESADDGRTWKEITGWDDSWSSPVISMSSHNIYILNQDKDGKYCNRSVRMSSNSGLSWNSVQFKDDIYSICIAENSVYICGRYHLFTNKLSSETPFSSITLPSLTSYTQLEPSGFEVDVYGNIYAPAICTKSIKPADSKIAIYNNSKQNWDFEAYGWGGVWRIAVVNNVIFVYLQGNILKYKDIGSSKVEWHNAEVPGCIAGVVNNEVYVFTGSELYKTKDGKNREKIKLPSEILK